MSRVDSYKERERGEREGSPIPVVELYDTSGAQVFIVFLSLFILFSNDTFLKISEIKSNTLPLISYLA
jgi:hypothetical protein